MEEVEYEEVENSINFYFSGKVTSLILLVLLLLHHLPTSSRSPPAAPPLPSLLPPAAPPLSLSLPPSSSSPPPSFHHYRFLPPAPIVGFFSTSAPPHSPLLRVPARSLVPSILPSHPSFRGHGLSLGPVPGPGPANPLLPSYPPPPPSPPAGETL